MTTLTELTSGVRLYYVLLTSSTYNNTMIKMLRKYCEKCDCRILSGLVTTNTITTSNDYIFSGVMFFSLSGVQKIAI